MLTELGNVAKSISLVLAAATTLAYASGYLVLRARAHALGTDPTFKLLDETYVFAGFRFLFVSAIALLIVFPLLVAVWSLASWVARNLDPKLLKTVEWVAAGGLVLLAVLGFLTLRASGVLLEHHNGSSAGPSSVLAEAVLGANSLGFWITLVTVALAAMAGMWLQARWAEPVSSLTLVLIVVALLQAFMLPVHHGILFADRKVRVLDRVPPSLSDVAPPVGVVDRAGDYVTLFGQTGKGERRLVTIKLEDLKGTPVVAIDRLQAFIERLKKAAVAGAVLGTISLAAANLAAQPRVYINPPQAAAQPGATSMNEMKRSYWTLVVDHFKATFEFISSLGEGEAVRGQVWLAEVDGVKLRGVARPIGQLSDLSWPVLGPDGQTVYALQKRQVVRLSPDGRHAKPIGDESDWSKLIGVAPDGTVFGLIAGGSFGRPAILASDGQLSVALAPAGSEERAKQAALLSESRAYSDGRQLVVRRSERGGRGFDVFIRYKGQPATNLSDCGDDFCGQPSLSPDGRYVLWIRSTGKS